MPIPFLNRQRTLEELQADNERAEVELSVAQKRAAIAKLKENGLTGKSFGWDWKRIWVWFKNH